MTVVGPPPGSEPNKYAGVLHQDSWAGRLRTPVVILRETPKRYLVQLPDGTEKLVPKYAVTTP